MILFGGLQYPVAAIAEDELSPDLAWFIKVIESQCVGNGKEFDDFGHQTGLRVCFIEGNFLERFFSSDSVVQR